MEPYFHPYLLLHGEWRLSGSASLKNKCPVSCQVSNGVAAGFYEVGEGIW